MKVAVLLFGQPRDAVSCSESIMKNLVQCNNADVFMHTWYDKDNLYMEKGEKGRKNCTLPIDVDKELLKIYKPKSWCIEPQKFQNFNNYDCDYYDCPRKFVENMQKCGKNKEMTYDMVKSRIIKYSHLSQLYSIFKANMLKEEYSLEHNILYDCVVKLRYDIIVNKPINISAYTSKKFLYFNIGQPDRMLCDWFQLGTNEMMNIVCSIFLQLKYLNNTQGWYKDRLPVTIYDTTKCTCSPELLIRDILHLYNIPWEGKLFDIELSPNT